MRRGVPVRAPCREEHIPEPGDDHVYDIGEHVSRFIHTIATTSPHVPEAKRPDEQALLEILMARKNPDENVPPIPEGERARDVYARHMQTVMGEAYNNDVSDLSISETKYSIEYFAFPNAFFFPGLQIPMTYRFRPDGDARDGGVDRMIFEVLFLRPKPQSGNVPEPVEPFDLDVDDSYTTVPGIAGSLGVVFDQDARLSGPCRCPIDAMQPRNGCSLTASFAAG